MAIGTNTEAKNLNYWDDGMPSEDIQSGSTNLSEVTFWVDGMPYVTVFPSASPANKLDTMMPFFWGIG